MAINYIVDADVVDINSDQPRANDRFLLDTNILFWFTYSNLFNGSPSHKDAQGYTSYVKKCLKVKAELYRSGLSLAELASIIETTSYEVFKDEKHIPKLLPKEFRHNYPIERLALVTQIQKSWSDIEAITIQADISIDQACTSKVLGTLKNYIADGYDLFIIETMKKLGINNIITDDGDYATIPGITVFTKNTTVISDARDQKKLIQKRK